MRYARTLTHSLCWFVVSASALHAAETAVIPGSPTPTEVLQAVYTNGETFTRVDDYVDGGVATDEGAVMDLYPFSGLSGKTDQTWTGGVITATAKARNAGFNHSFGWERGGTTTLLFAVGGSGYAVTGSASGIDLNGGPFRWIDDTGFNVWSSDVDDNTDNLDHMIAYYVTGGATTGPTWALFFDDQNGGGDRDFNDIMIEVVLTVTNPTCESLTATLTSGAQGSVCQTSFRPTTTGGSPAPFVLTARTGVDYTLPLDPDASGSAGKVHADSSGFGVKTADCSGTKGLNGSGSEKDEELIFTFDSPVFADAIILTLNSISFSSDAPVVFISSTSSSGYDYTIPTSEVQSAFTFTSSSRGELNFAEFTSIPSNLTIDGFKIREVKNKIYVKVFEMVVPCDDGNPCTVDTCVDNACEHTPAPNGTACSDGVFCNGQETCQGGLCVEGSNPCIDLAHCDEDKDECLKCLDDAECNDGNVCTSDKCGYDGVCHHTNNNNPCSDGNACTINDCCGGGVCVPGVPLTCADGNACTTDSCNPATGCVFANNTNPCNDGNACTTNDACSGGSCAGGPAPNCDDSNICTNDSCNPASGCVHTDNTVACNDGNACTTGDACSGGSCAGGPPVTCNDGNICTDDSCNPASGCVFTDNAAPCDDGNACTKNDECAGGSCQSGAPANCNDSNMCTVDSCDPVNGCSHAPIVCNDNNPCTNDSCNPASGCVFTDNTNSCDDGSACTVNDTCGGGSCAGVPIVCNDNNVCTTDSCNPATGCVYTNNSVPCDDTNACTTGDTCAGGFCVGGPAPNCDDSNVCTDDACNPNTGCVHADNADPCDDGSACTTNDTCSGGSCVGGPAPDCDDSNECTADSCNPASGCVNADLPNGSACGDPGSTDCDNPDSCNGGVCVPNHDPNGSSCADGLVCNGDEVCQGGVCQPGTPIPDCCKTNAECSDDNVCNGVETCVSNACVAGTPLDCEDNNPCTDDSCDPILGCIHTDNTDPCDDGDACTTNDTCSAGSCVGGAAPNCDDGNVCTDDSCNPATGCVHTDNSASCDDGNACTTNDTCAGGSCVGGVAPNCDDGNVCTDDSCNPLIGCVNANNTNPCSDGTVCTTNDLCQAGTCVGGAPLVCDDGNGCTSDACHPVNGCEFTNNAAPCDDGNPCTLNDVCGGGSCQSGAPMNCADGVDCTIDSCDTNTGSCVHTADDGYCDDDQFCNGAEFCSVIAGCQTSSTMNALGGVRYRSLANTGGEEIYIGPNMGSSGYPNRVEAQMSWASPGSHSISFSYNPGADELTTTVTPGTTLTYSNASAHFGSGPCTLASMNLIRIVVADRDAGSQVDFNSVIVDGNLLGSFTGDGTYHFYDFSSAALNDGFTFTGTIALDGPFSSSQELSRVEILFGCQAVVPPVCDDGNGCTTDSCDNALGCIFVNNSDPCDDGNACTTNDTCSGGSCVGGPAPDCNDGNVCTDDSCNPLTGCVHTNNTDPCNDGNACTLSDVCFGGSCIGGMAPNCDDGNVCTDDACHPQVGCVNVNNVDPCDDGNACTTNDTCAGGSCVGGPPPVCDDGNECTTDTCAPASGCVFTDRPSGSLCGDGADTSCDNPDTCDGAGNCQDNLEPDGTSCADGVYCNGNEVCIGGFCETGTPIPGCCKADIECDNDDVCDGIETCVNHGCVAGTPLSCDDGNPCTNDSCDPILGCVHVNNTDPCDDGNACTTSDTCAGGACVGGPAPNCDDSNVCTTDSCNPAIGCVHEDNTLPCDDGNACTTADTCAGGSCVGGAAPNCNDGNVCTDDSCDTLLGCVHVNNIDPCDDGNACTTADTCADSSCVGGPPPNCDDNNICTDDSCDTVLGCLNVDNTDPCDDNNACTSNDACSGGLCAGGPAIVCADGNPCTDDGCDPQSGCVFIDNAEPCSDNDACTTNDVCTGGSCVGGPAPNCDDGNPCTDDSCGTVLGCIHVDNTLPCDDLDACTTNDVCTGGSCVGGPPPNCDDANECTLDFCSPPGGCVNLDAPSGTSCGDPANTDCDNPDACDGNGNCVPNHEPDGTSCADALFCNGPEVCVGGLCTPGLPPPPPCCETDADCDDDDVCNGVEACVAHQCVLGTPLTCVDGNVCTDDSCDPIGGCVYTNNTDPCDDGDACTIGDVCAGGACQSGGPLDCADGNLCTTDSCNPATGCVHTDNSNACDDGNACTLSDVCVAGQCVGGPAPNCNDGNGCTDDACDPQVGCVNVNNTDPCDDGNACTSNDACAGGNCVGGKAVVCNDGNVCTTDSCDTVTGCVYVDNSDPCSDGSACTTNDVCSGGSCVGGPAPNCDDLNACTDDACDPMLGCRNVPNSDPCDDGNACTTNDACSGGSCTGGPPPDCDDGNVCTDDACDSVLGCVHVDNTDPCDDNNACTVNDTCSNGACAGSVPLNCNDNNPCTDDSCHPAVGCVFTNNTDPCDDGSMCTAADVCVGGHCLGGGALNCNDSNVCTTDSCHPTLGCQHVNNTNPCNDGEYCTGNDQCQAGVCVGRGSPCPDQICVEASDQCVDCQSNADCDDGDNCTNDACDGQSCQNDPIACTVDGECPGNARCINNECTCDLSLCLLAEPGDLPVDNCYSLGDEIVVNIVVNNAQSPIVGGQFYFAYDPTALQFVSIVPGGEVDPNSPFTVEVQEIVDEANGTIFYVVAIGLDGIGQNGEGAGTEGPAVLATITFTAIKDCLVDGVCFLPDANPLHTLLVDRTGARITPDDLTCCTGDFNINGSPPEINCPDNIITNADCNTPTAQVEFPPLVANDNCDGNLPFVPACTATYWASGQVGIGVPLDLSGLVLPSGGEFPPGITEITCTATNSCGLSATCQFTVTVTGDTTLEVVVQLSPIIDVGPISRCIEFQLFNNCVEGPLGDSVFLPFGPPFNFPGHGDVVRAKIPAGQYACITARDPYHTLRSVSTIECVDGKFVAEFKGDPLFGGNWLVSGNLDGSHVIDILDFGVLVSQYLKPMAPDVLCGTVGHHADINGDGIVDILDFSFITANFLAEDKDSCCEDPEGGVGGAPVLSISVEDLVAQGMEKLTVADINGDGVLDQADIAAFLDNGGIVPNRPKPVSRPPGRVEVDPKGQNRPTGTR